MSSNNFGGGFNQLLDTENLKKLYLTKQNADETISLDNIPGKQASVKILYNIADNSIISTNEALRGLVLYGDYTDEEKQQPNSHPNIRLLLNIIANNESWTVNAE